MVLAAAAQDGYALRHGASDFRADKEVVLAAVAQGGALVRTCTCCNDYTAAYDAIYNKWVQDIHGSVVRLYRRIT